MQRKFIALSLLLLFISFSCDLKSNGVEQKVIFTSIQPIAYLLDHLTSDSVQSKVLVRPGYSPASYELLPSQVKALAASKLWLKAGHLGYEKAWKDRIAGVYPGLIQINLSKSLDLISMADIQHGDHSHPGGIDPHTWTGPNEVKIMIGEIRQSIEAESKLSELIDDSAYTHLRWRIDSLIDNHTERMAPYQGRRLYIFHPSLGYYCRQFGIEQVAIEDQGKEPSPLHLSSMHAMMEQDSARAILVQREFDQEHAQVIAKSLGIDLIIIDPLQYDWFKMMDDIASAIEEALGKPSQK